MLVYIKAVNLYKHWGKYLVLPFNLESAMHSTRIIVFFLAAFKIASCLDNSSVVNWYCLPFCEVLANRASLARVSKVPLAQRSHAIQNPRTLLSKTARSQPPAICNLQLRLALLFKTARPASLLQSKLYPLPTSRPPLVSFNLEHSL